MKLGLMFALLLLSQLALAESVRGKRIKEEMLTRVDNLILQIEESREALDREDVITACQKINDIFKIIPKHLVAVGTSMNLLDSKVIRMEQETKMFLIYMHQRSNICAQGETGEYLDLKETDKKLKSMRKMLEKQRKLIRKKDTDYENTYHYYYEF